MTFNFFASSIAIISLIFYSCQNAVTQENLAEAAFEQRDLSYSRAFSIYESDSSINIKTHFPGRENEVIQCIHINEQKAHPNCMTILEKPSRVIVLSTTYLSFIELLEETDALVGVSNPQWIFSKNIQSKIEKGAIENVGNDRALDFEKVVALNPDLIMIYDFGMATNQIVQKLQSLNLNVLKLGEYLEESPLGKAEWIKFFGLVFSKSALAEKHFSTIEKAYLDLIKEFASYPDTPVVFTGLPWKGEWHQPGGASFQAKYFKDAGADYVWKNDESVSGILMDREVIFNEALDADYWIHPGAAQSLAEISNQDDQFVNFESFKKGKVYNNNKRINALGGNDYWESGVVNPHIILKDLLVIFHPEFDPKHELFYYQKLE